MTRRVVVGGIVRRQFGVDRLVAGLGARRIRLGAVARGFCIRLGAGVFLVALLVGGLVGFVGRRLAHRDAVVEAEHDDDGVRLLGGEDALGGGGPIGRLALGLILDQAGDGLVLADHAHIGLFGIGVLKTVGEPVGHGVAEHQHVTLRHGFALGRRRRPGEILARRLRAALLLLERRKEVAAEPAAAATLRRRPLRRTAETHRN